MDATISDSKRIPNESHIVGRLEYEVRRRGANYLAYPPVVAAGNRANIIHYIASNQVHLSFYFYNAFFVFSQLKRRIVFWWIVVAILRDTFLILRGVGR